MSADGNTLFGQKSENVPAFAHSTMRRKPFEALAISPEPGAITPFRCDRKMLTPNNFRKPVHCFIGIHTALLIHDRSLYINC